MSGSNSEEQIPAEVHSRTLMPKWGTTGVLSVETSRMVITFPEGSQLPDVHQYVKPREVVRKDDVTLRVNSGFWQFGWLTLKFNSKEDADKVELRLHYILPG